MKTMMKLLSSPPLPEFVYFGKRTSPRIDQQRLRIIILLLLVTIFFAITVSRDINCPVVSNFLRERPSLHRLPFILFVNR